MKSEAPVEGSWQRASRAVRNVPADVVAVAVFVGLAYLATLVSPFRETILRPLVALPLLFFVPGYALLGVLFPRRAGARTGGGTHAGETPAPVGGRIDLPERLALSVGASVVLVPLAGLAVTLAGWPLSPSTAVHALGGFALIAMGLGWLRRERLPPEARFRLPYDRWLDRARAALAAPRRDVLLNVVLAASVVLATGGFAYALAVPTDGEAYTDFSLLTEDGGDLVAAGYPSDLTAGESTELVVGIENHEGEQVEYTVVVVLERVDDGAIVEREHLDRFSTTVAPGETVHERHEVTPTMTGEDLRLSYYLYRGDAPDQPSADSAYRHLYIWVDVAPAT